MRNKFICDTVEPVANGVIGSDVIQKVHGPNSIRMAEADKVLAAHGYRLDRQKGSHCQYINANGDVITIKSENPLKAVYIKDILSRI